MPDLPRRRRLKGLRVSRVDLVPAGDNPDAHITLAKARPLGGPAVPTLPDDLQHLAPLADLTPEDFAKVGEYVTGVLAEHAAADAFLAAHRDEAATLTKERDDALAVVEKVRKGEPLPDADPIYKDLPPEARERLEKAERESAAAAEAVAKMERERRVEKAAAEAADSMRHLGDAAQVGDLLVVVEDKAGAEVAKTLRQIMAAANEKIAKGDLFAEVGRGDVDPASAQGRLDAAAEALQKADPALTRPQAISKALDANPGLGAEVQAEAQAS